MHIEIPDYKILDLEYLVLDFNGTIAIDGEISDAVKKRLSLLSEEFKIYVLTADTHGNAKEKCEGLLVTIKTFPQNGALEEKKAVVQQLGTEKCVSVGNGRNDTLMCRVSGLSIGVLEKEGMCGRIFADADICVKSIEDALDLLLYPKRLIATLRG